MAAGPGQDLDHPLGVGGKQLHEWVYPTRTFQAMFGGGDGTIGVDDDFAARGFEGIGAWILGRNMFGPPRGPWTMTSGRAGGATTRPITRPFSCSPITPEHRSRWRAAPFFTLSPTAFTQPCSGPRKPPATRDVRLGGGPATIRQYLKAGLVDTMHLAISPVLLGSGESLLADFDPARLGYRCSEHTSSAAAMHVVLTKS